MCHCWIYSFAFLYNNKSKKIPKWLIKRSRTSSISYNLQTNTKGRNIIEKNRINKFIVHIVLKSFKFSIDFLTKKVIHKSWGNRIMTLLNSFPIFLKKILPASNTKGIHEWKIIFDFFVNHFRIKRLYRNLSLGDERIMLNAIRIQSRNYLAIEILYRYSIKINTFSENQ